MELLREINDWNRSNKKEELEHKIKDYDGLLSDSNISYLKSLINLEFSVVRDYISDADRAILSEYEIYNRIARYNINNRVLNLFKNNDRCFAITGNNYGINGLYVNYSTYKTHYCLFDFNYNNKPINSNNRRKIGDISLYQIIESKEQREAEIMYLKSQIDRLSQVTIEDIINYLKLKGFEAKLCMLESKDKLSDDEKKGIEIVNMYHELLLEDYGLSLSDFKDESYTGDTKLQKTLTKKIPSLTINNVINYL